MCNFGANDGDMDPCLQFLGAAGTVTGSRFLITTDRTRVLVDCGLFQGGRELRLRNWQQFPARPEDIEAVVLSHAHLDHCGYLPALVKQGFAGPVFATQGTAELAEIVLHDSAHLLQEDAEHARAHGYSKHDPPLPLYTDEDVATAMSLVKTVGYDERIVLGPGIEASLGPAGHILGSSIVSLSIKQERGRSHRIVFSGDLGRPNHPLLLPPAAPHDADTLVIESTYGNRMHKPDSGGAFARTIQRTIRRGGSVVIPAFAVDRTEVILMSLRQLRRSGQIPAVPVYVDSPMALASLDVYARAAERHAPELRTDLAPPGELFDPGDLHELRTVEESKMLNAPQWPCVIISASGMATGGRVLHHLAGMLPDPRNTVVLAGYQAVGTRGRALQDGATSVKIHGCYVPVRAEIVDMPFFSVHADADELLDWLASAPKPPSACFIVHGEPAAAEALRSRIDRELRWLVAVARDGERVRLV